MKKELCEITSYDGVGYKTLVNYDKWRVAVMNYVEELTPENITEMEKHNETDEVFVLLNGKGILFIGECDSSGKITDILPLKMETNKLYNVRKGVYHTHSITAESSILLVENSDTSDINTTKEPISDYLKNNLYKLFHENI